MNPKMAGGTNCPSALFHQQHLHSHLEETESVPAEDLKVTSGEPWHLTVSSLRTSTPVTVVIPRQVKVAYSFEFTCKRGEKFWIGESGEWADTLLQDLGGG